ncbi:MAG: radical SAM protein, partial [Candidatus Aminicenantes bacterium]|nr:radical SAM protein [Candidatus Aminicenantes bacterium]
MKPRVALISFGCAKNLVDSEVMLGLLKRAGYSFTANPSAADIVILNTCGFIQPARDEAQAAIRGAVRLKRSDPNKRVVVAGCTVRRNREALARSYPQVDDWLDVTEFDRIVPTLENRRPGRRPRETFLYSHLSPRVVSTPKGWAYVKVSEGCSHRCGFCSIPLIKGPYRSRPMASIVEETRELAGRGVKEINIVSQDTTYYVRDFGWKDGIARLLQKLVIVRGVAWIRLLYGYPEEVHDSLLEIMQDKKLCPYFDLPFQHADGRLLR